MPVSLDQFVRSVSESGLIPAAEIRAFVDGLSPTTRPTDGDTLAQLLVQSGKLTRYQAAAVVQGKAENLILEQYVILDKIGQGGMGVVLKARHRRMDRVVAMKVLPPAAMESPQAVDRFYREVKAAAKLSHPNIVAAHDANEHAGVHYLVMEYVDGTDLAAVIKEHGPLPVRQAVECVLQAARGLQYAHEQGVIHRDIKPANLLLDKKGTVKILDMGLARMEQSAREDVGGDRLTESGQIMGTGEYMAPEQALNTHNADARSDIYSLGCTLYRLLTGKLPYHGETFMELFIAHREAPIPSLCAVQPEVPAELDAIFQKMIAKYAHERQQSMAEVIADFDTFLGMHQAAGGEEEPLSDGPLVFLRDITQGGTGTRQSVHAKVEDTLAPNGHPEIGTNFRFRSLRSLKQRKGPTIAMTAGTAVLLSLTALGIMITIRSRGGEKTMPRVPVAVHAQALGQLIEEQKFAEAQRYLNDLQDQARQIYQAAAIQRLRSNLASVLSVENNRKSKLAEHFARVRSLFLINPTWGAFSIGAESLQQAEKLARTDAERAEIKEMYRRLEENRSKLQSEVDDSFGQELTAFRKRLAEVDKNDAEGRRKSAEIALDLQARPRVSASLKEALSPLVARLLRESVDPRQEADLSDRITNSVGTYEKYLPALGAYTKAFPLATRSRDFRRVLDREAAYWRALEGWSRLVRQWSRLDLLSISAPHAAELAQLVGATLDDPEFVKLPGAVKLGEILSFLKATAQRIDEHSREPIAARLEAPLSNKAVKSLQMAVGSNGARYYFHAAPTRLGNAWAVWYYTGLDLVQRKSVRLADSELQNSIGVDAPDWTSPQAAFSRKARDSLHNLTDANWESTFFDLLVSLYDDRRMEPLVKLQLMQFILDVACQGSHCLAKTFQADLDLLKSASLDRDANYIDPLDSKGREAREAANLVLQRLHDPRIVASQAAEYARSMRYPSLGPSYRWVGWLHRVQSDEWACSAPGLLAGGKAADLFVLIPPDGDDPVQIRKIGVCDGGKFTLDPAAGLALVEGRPVFVADQEPSKSSR